MKKRAMKKWIPRGVYCHGTGTKKYPYCKWRKYIGIKKINNTNCEYANTCEESESDCDCSHSIYKCEYMNYIDFEQNSLLWDACKECGVKDE